MLLELPASNQTSETSQRKFNNLVYVLEFLHFFSDHLILAWAADFIMNVQGTAYHKYKNFEWIMIGSNGIKFLRVWITKTLIDTEFITVYCFLNAQHPFRYHLNYGSQVEVWNWPLLALMMWLLYNIINKSVYCQWPIRCRHCCNKRSAFFLHTFSFFLLLFGWNTARSSEFVFISVCVCKLIHT